MTWQTVRAFDIVSATSTSIADGGDGNGSSYGLLPQLLGYHLRRAQIALFAHFAQKVTLAEDITPGLFGMLQVIAANPGLSQSRLAEAMGVDRSTVVKVVDGLERRGLIARVGLPHDRRRYSLQLTEFGVAAVRRMEARVLAHEQKFTAMLSAEERRTLVDLLVRLAARTEQPAEAALSQGRDE